MELMKTWEKEALIGAPISVIAAWTPTVTRAHGAPYPAWREFSDTTSRMEHACEH